MVAMFFLGGAAHGELRHIPDGAYLWDVFVMKPINFSREETYPSIIPYETERYERKNFVVFGKHCSAMVHDLDDDSAAKMLTQCLGWLRFWEKCPPKDGTEFLGWAPKIGVMIMRFDLGHLERYYQKTKEELIGCSGKWLPIHHSILPQYWREKDDDYQYWLL